MELLNAANLALKRSAEASSTESSAFQPALAFDGDTTTRWSSAFSDPQWLQVDLGQVCEISKVVIHWEAAFASEYDIQLKVDDETTSPWITAATVTLQAAGIATTALGGERAQFVRMNGRSRGTGEGYSIVEMQVFGMSTASAADTVCHPDAGPEPTAHAPNRFELLRRAKDLAVGLGESYFRGKILPGLFCQFDKETGWPVYSMKEDGGPVPDGICKIDETAARGISVRQLLVVYDLVKQRCDAEGWTNWAGELLTPENVTLYDLTKYVIMPATEAHQCSYVELVTGAGEESARRCPDGHVPMARTKVYPGVHQKTEEVSCTQCAKKLEEGAIYWVCHRCGGRHKLCGACAPPPAPVKCAELKKPLWFASHWYGRRRSPPQLAVPRTHVPRSKQVGGARLPIHRVPPPARTRSVLHRRRRRLVARYPILGVRVREQPARVRLPFPAIARAWRSPTCGAEQRARRLGGDVPDDPAASSFAKAMETSIGTVAIIDEDATVFNRIWCVLCATH